MFAFRRILACLLLILLPAVAQAESCDIELKYGIL
ncbi:MAG: hypothetical protein ACI8WB_003932, partial [Phenylobacterium sp.]